MACWARRNFAALTIFIALVSCRVLWTERILRRMSLVLAMSGGSGRGLGERLELLLEGRERRLQLAAKRVVQSFLRPDLLEQLGGPGVDPPVQFPLEDRASG